MNMMKTCLIVGSSKRHMISQRRDCEEIITLVHQKTIGTLALFLGEHVNLFIEHSLLSMNDGAGDAPANRDLFMQL